MCVCVWHANCEMTGIDTEISMSEFVVIWSELALSTMKNTSSVQCYLRLNA